MSEDLTAKRIIRVQREINHHMRDTIAAVRDRASSHIQYAKDQKFTPAAAVVSIFEMCEKELFWLDAQGAKLDEIRRGDMDRNQGRLDVGKRRP